MSAFATALASLHADANLSVACTWYPGWGRDQVMALEPAPDVAAYLLTVTGTALRGIRSQEQAQSFGAGVVGGVAEREFLDVAIADLADMRRGDLIVIGAGAFLVETVERDNEALTWRLTLSEA